MYLYVDYREKWFLNYFRDEEHIKFANLPIGDFIISNDLEMKEILLAIERKTIKDLSSSITDGRFREQKARLLDSLQDESKILYIIEGSQKVLKNGVSRTILDSSIINLLFKHNFKVINTENTDDTYNNINLLYKKFKTDDFNKKQSINPVQLIAKKDKIKENILAMQLSMISGVSYNTALLISEKYNTVKNIILEYEKLENEKDKENLFADFQLNSRKLGGALSKKIYKALCLSE